MTHKLVINGRPKDVEHHRLTYRDLVELAYPGDRPDPTITYTVAYANPFGKDGTLTEGQEGVEVQEGMVCNVTKTNRS